MIPEEHKHGFMIKSLRFMAYSLAAYNVLKGLFYLGVGIYSLFNPTKYGLIPIVNSLIYFSVYGLLLPIIYISIIHLFSDVLVDDQGLKIKFFNKFLPVNWDDILEVKPIVSFGLFKLRDKKIIITRSRLSFVHVIYGIVYGGTMKPSLLIQTSISDYSSLMEKISKQAKINYRLKSKNDKALNKQNQLQVPHEADTSSKQDS